MRLRIIESAITFLRGCVRMIGREMIDYRSPNLRLKESVPNDWTDVGRQPLALDALFEKFNKSIIVLSYKKFGVPASTPDQNAQAAREERSHVQSALQICAQPSEWHGEV